MEPVTDHCSVHSRSNQFCPSCIEALKASAKPASEPAPKSEDNPSPKEEVQEDHHDS